MNAICLITDRLQAGYLGCYGNAWIATPASDELACESFVFDQALASHSELPELIQCLWPGRLLERLSAAGVQTALLTDEPLAAEHELATGFGERHAIAAASATRTAADLEETHFAHFFSAAAEWLANAPEPFCLWLHCRGMAAPWDAPRKFRQRYADADGPPLPRFVDPPAFVRAKGADPDELLALRWAYAAQVSLWDACLDGFLESLRTGGLLDRSLLVLAGARGYPLGEHRLVGDASDAGLFRLHEELVHVPLLVREPLPGAASSRSGDRSQALVETSDLPATLADWFGLPPGEMATAGRSLLPLARGEADALRQAAFLRGPGEEIAVRTPAWHLLCRHAGDAGVSPRQLYAKPDDRWEANEVADRCAEIAEALVQLAVEHRAGRTDSAAALPEALLHGIA